MLTIEGDYTDVPDQSLGPLKYVTRVFSFTPGQYVDGVGMDIVVRDGDVLMVLGGGTWFALYSAHPLTRPMPRMARCTGCGAAIPETSPEGEWLEKCPACVYAPPAAPLFRVLPAPERTPPPPPPTLPPAA